MNRARTKRLRQRVKHVGAEITSAMLGAAGWVACGGPPSLSASPAARTAGQDWHGGPHLPVLRRRSRSRGWRVVRYGSRGADDVYHRSAEEQEPPHVLVRHQRSWQSLQPARVAQSRAIRQCTAYLRHRLGRTAGVRRPLLRLLGGTVVPTHTLTEAEAFDFRDCGNPMSSSGIYTSATRATAAQCLLRRILEWSHIYWRSQGATFISVPQLELFAGEPGDVPIQPCEPVDRSISQGWPFLNCSSQSADRRC
jgi:hypothetical protein